MEEDRGQDTHECHVRMCHGKLIHRIAVPLFPIDYCLVAAGAFALPVSLNAALKPVANFSAGPVPQ